MPPRTAVALGSLLALASCVHPDAQRPRGTLPVRSLLELRRDRVVAQAWDLSCGSAALSTLLTYDLRDPVEEVDVVAGLLEGAVAARVQARGGFTLLDLKRWAQGRGYRVEGYGRIQLAGLLRLAPAIVPTLDRGAAHFMIVRDAAEGRLVLADPAYGVRTLRWEEFDAIWTPRVALVVRREGEEAAPLGTARAPIVPAHVIRASLGRLR